MAKWQNQKRDNLMLIWPELEWVFLIRVYNISAIAHTKFNISELVFTIQKDLPSNL